MKYNTKYDRWFSKEGLVYRYDEKKDRLVLVKLEDCKGYNRFTVNKKHYLLHRAMWETFISDIPNNLCIDHIDTNKNNNRIENLRLVTHKENTNNPLTLSKIKSVLTERNKNRNNFKNGAKNPRTEFGRKFYEHYKIFRSDNLALYNREVSYYCKTGHCRWEEE